MQETPGFARIEQSLSKETIVPLAGLYDRAANALDPFSSDRAEAERLFNIELRGLYDLICSPVRPGHQIEFRDFKRAVISRCRKHLKASDRPIST